MAYCISRLVEVSANCILQVVVKSGKRSCWNCGKR